MRKLLYLCLAGLLALGCSKEKMASTPCRFQLKVDWVKGSRAQFTVTPENPEARYCYGVIPSDHPLYNRSDAEIIRYQMDWMNSDYANLRKEGKVQGEFEDLFCYKGTRSIKSRLLPPDLDHKLLVFQVDPETDRHIGSLNTVVFHTRPVPQVELTFTIQYKDNMFRILPSDQDVTWFWEYETQARIEDVYGSPYYFFYDIIDMYDEYGFLEHNLATGNDEWVLPRDDRSIKEGVTYILMLAACSKDGEIESEVNYAAFTYRDGKVQFIYADFPLEPLD